MREGDPEWRDDVPVRVETIPVRRAGRVIAVVAPQHQPARRAHAEPAGAVLPADRGRPDPDDRRAATSRPRASAATTPTRRGSATGSCGSTPPGGSSTPAPTRCRSTAGSACPATSPGWCSPTSTRELVPPRRRPGRGDAVSAVLGGRAHRDTELGSRRRLADRPLDPAAPAGRAHRRAGAGARRHRPAPPRPRAGHQGRDHPRDPPPGEEQPADGRRAAAAAGPPDGLRRGAKSALEEAVRRVGSIAIVHETLSQAVEEQVDFDEVADRLGRMVTEVSAAGEHGRGSRATAPSACCASETATALAMVLTEVLQNAVEHGYDAERRRRGPIVVSARPAGRPAARHRRRRRRGLPGGLRPGRVDQPGAVDRAHAGGVRARRAARARAAARRARAPGSRSTYPCSGS